MAPRFDPRPFPVAVEAPPAPPPGAPRLLSIGHLLFAPPRAGNEYRLDGLLRHLGESWDISVVVCTHLTPTEEQFRALARCAQRVVVCERGGTVWHHAADGAALLAPLRGTRAARILEWPGLRPSDRRLARLWRAFCPDLLVALLQHLDTAWRPDLLLAEYAFMARAFPHLRPDLPKVIDTLDVFSEKAAKVEAHGVSDGMAMDPVQEAALLGRADALLAVHAGDALALARLAPGAAVVSAGVDIAVTTTAPPPDGPPGLLMVGADNPMNVAGLRDFLAHAWPAIRRAAPEAGLRVVGSVGPALGDAPPGVTFAGRVADLGAEYAAASVAINPAFAGTGLKIKSVEAVGHGRPLVAFPAGVDGMDGSMRRLVHVAQDWPEFAALCIALLRGAAPGPGLRAELAAALSAARVYAPASAAFAALATRPRPTPPIARRQPRLLCLLARHGADAYPDAPAALQGLLARRLPETGHAILTIDTALPPGEHAPEPSGRVIGAPNASWEFSAWDTAVARLGDAIEAHDAVALVTSAFGQLSPRHLERLGPRALAIAGSGRAAAGHVDHFNEPVWIAGHALQAWLRSAFILLAPALLRRLGPLATFTDRAAFFTGDAAAPWKQDAPISDTYRGYITGWLTGEGTGQGVAWHSRAPLTPATLPRFEAKALAILNEQMLTQRLCLHGAAPADLTWIAANPGAAKGRLPDWRRQVARRRGRWPWR